MLEERNRDYNTTIHLLRNKLNVQDQYKYTSSVHLVYICFGGMDHVDMIYFDVHTVVSLNAFKILAHSFPINVSLQAHLLEFRVYYHSIFVSI
jgi:hypothetical protein